MGVRIGVGLRTVGCLNEMIAFKLEIIWCRTGVLDEFKG